MTDRRTPPLEPGEPPYGDPDLTLLWFDPDDWTEEQWANADQSAAESAADWADDTTPQEDR